METMEENQFIEAMGFRETTLSENGATKLFTTGSELVNQIATAANYRDRSIDDVFANQSALYEEDAEASIRFIFYLRMITRQTRIHNGQVTESVQKGQGCKDESIKRLLWVAKNHNELFVKNLWILPFVGSWKDLWVLMFYDKKYELNCVDHNLVFALLMWGLGTENVADLVKKYMPSIKANSKCKTKWTKFTNDAAKEFAHFMGLNDYLKYNKVKSSGKAHEFQKLISTGRFGELVWRSIPGRALSLLVSGKFLENHGLVDGYMEWLSSQDTAKFTGYPFELAHRLDSSSPSKATKLTCDLQFNNLVQQAKDGGKITENVLVALDTSGSMMTPACGIKNITCSDIASSLAIFFSRLNDGFFKNLVMMFDDDSYPYQLHGESFSDDLMNLPRVPCGGTNFQSVVEALKRIRTEEPEIPLEEYPTTILCISDMEFNPTPSWRSIRRGSDENTNYEYSVASLKEVFPEEFVDNMKFIWWNVASRSEHAFEGTSDTNGCIMVSGFDGALVSMLLGEEGTVRDSTGAKRNLTSEEMAEKLLSQEILNLVQI
jgi:hypothetical protein